MPKVIDKWEKFIGNKNWIVVRFDDNTLIKHPEKYWKGMIQAYVELKGDIE